MLGDFKYASAASAEIAGLYRRRGPDAGPWRRCEHGDFFGSRGNLAASPSISARGGNLLGFTNRRMKWVRALRR